MIKRSLIYSFTIALAALASVSIRVAHPQEERVDQRALGIQFDLKEERTFEGIQGTWWVISLILPRDLYSRGKLERIFRYYSEKHPDKKSILRVNVYADEGTYQRYIKTPACVIPSIPYKPEDNSQQNLPAKETWSIAHATYERLCYNEFYRFSPDLENPDKTELVVIKGKFELTQIPEDCE